MAFLFKHCGQFIFAPGTSEDKVMEIALDAGADDVLTDEEGVIEVVCPVPAFAAVRDAFAAAGLQAEMADIVMKPETEIELSGEDAMRMQKSCSTRLRAWMTFRTSTITSMEEQG